MIRPAMLACLLAFTTGPSAFAQSAWVETDDQVIVGALGLTVDEIDDMDVVDAAGQKIGEVEDVVGPTRTEATGIVIDLDTKSGLLANDEDIIVPLAGVEVHGKALRLLVDAATLRGYEIYQD